MSGARRAMGWMDMMGWWVGLDGRKPVRHVSKTYERQMDDRGGVVLDCLSQEQRTW